MKDRKGLKEKSPLLARMECLQLAMIDHGMTDLKGKSQFQVTFVMTRRMKGVNLERIKSENQSAMDVMTEREAGVAILSTAGVRVSLAETRDSVLASRIVLVAEIVTEADMGMRGVTETKVEALQQGKQPS